MGNMQQEDIIQKLTDLFYRHVGEQPISIERFPRTASGRSYFRMSTKERRLIGSYGKDSAENRAFIRFTEHFKKAGIRVPEVLESENDTFYIQEDLGDESLMNRNHAVRKSAEDFPESLELLYKKSIDQLTRMQIVAGKDLDYSNCYSRQAFDKTAMIWDLNYFKYYFLNVSGISYDPQSLENDFHALADYLLSTDTDYFLFRDFQSRNIMLVEDEPYFIDYQGGMKGALQYDLASLLYQSKARIPQALREKLLDYYMESASRFVSIKKEEFTDYYYGYVLIRLIQVLGAYGFRGLIEKHEYFINSIPHALDNLRWWLDNIQLPIDIPHLLRILKDLINAPRFKAFDRAKGEASPLVVKISSFSFREGIPEDHSGNGGGFVFDCRSIHNPGRYEPYKTQTGRDKPVQDFLLSQSHMPEFLIHVYDIVDKAVESYIERDFSSLMVNFGCTGGQHRSVFAADSLAKHLTEKYGVEIQLSHVVQERKNWVNERY